MENKSKKWILLAILLLIELMVGILGYYIQVNRIKDRIEQSEKQNIQK